MARVVLGMTISLDGYANDRNGSVERLHSDLSEIRDSGLMQAEIQRTGAVLMGRRAYEMGEGDYTGYEFQVPIFVLTHHPPESPATGQNDQLSFTFVTDGLESAVRRAVRSARSRRSGSSRRAREPACASVCRGDRGRRTPPRARTGPPGNLARPSSVLAACNDCSPC